MAAEVAAFLLKEKLQTLADKTNCGLKHRVRSAIEKLHELLTLLKEADISQEAEKNKLLSSSICCAEDAVDTYLLKRTQRRRLNCFPRFWAGKKLSGALKKFTNDLERLSFFSARTRDIQRQPAHGGESLGRRQSAEGIYDFLDVASEVVGVRRKQDIDHLVKELTTHNLEEPEFRVLPVVGSAGSGKTMMVRSIYDRVDIRRHFKCRAWVCVSRDFEFRDVVVGLLDQVNTNRLTRVDSVGDHVLADTLLSVLMEKKYLIVLDDVRNIKAWHELSILFPDSHNGSRVILTTRDDKAAKLADRWRDPLPLNPLTDKETWELFLKQVSTSDEFKETIMAKCGHSPVAAVLLGGVFSNTTASEWRRLTKKLETLSNDDSLLQNLFALAFQELPSRFKVCFLYFLLLFPAELEIPVRRVLRLWLSEGFLIRTSSEPDSELERKDLAEMCFETLARCKLIEVSKRKLDGSPKTCRQSWLVRDFFFNVVASGSFYAFQDLSSRQVEPTAKPCMDVQRYSKLLEIAECLDPHDNQLLRSYFYFNRCRGIGIFSRKLTRRKEFALLKVLDLEGVWRPTLHEAGVVGNLLLLTFLGLRSTGLDSIPSSVGDLPCLETLDLRHTNVTVLPGSIWKAKNLQHLLLEEVHITKIPSKVSLISLQTLTGLYIDDQKVVSTVLDRLVNLQKLGLTCRKESLEVVAKWVERLSHLRSLQLRSINEFGKPSELEFVPIHQESKLWNLYLLGRIPSQQQSLDKLLLSRSLRKLTLSMSALMHDPMPMLGELEELLVLRLFARSYEGVNMICKSEGFSKLRTLKLWMLDKVETFTVEKGAMTRLRDLEVRGCNCLKALSGLEHLQSLKNLTLTDMPKTLVKAVMQNVPRRELHVQVNDWKLSRHEVNQGEHEEDDEDRRDRDPN